MNLYECCFKWHLQPQGRIENGDVIIAQCGGERESGEPGEINKYLKEIIRVIASQRPNIPIIAQGELAKCLTGLNMIARTKTQKESKQSGEGYITTRDVALFHKNICDERGFKSPILISFQPHLVRAAAATHKVGLQVIVPDIPHHVYDPKCSQKWLRHRISNGIREIGARLHDKYKGWI